MSDLAYALVKTPIANKIIIEQFKNFGINTDGDFCLGSGTLNHPNDVESYYEFMAKRNNVWKLINEINK